MVDHANEQHLIDMWRYLWDVRRAEYRIMAGDRHDAVVEELGVAYQSMVAGALISDGFVRLDRRFVARDYVPRGGLEQDLRFDLVLLEEYRALEGRLYCYPLRAAPWLLRQPLDGRYSRRRGFTLDTGRDYRREIRGLVTERMIVDDSPVRWRNDPPPSISDDPKPCVDCGEPSMATAASKQCETCWRREQSVFLLVRLVQVVGEALALNLAAGLSTWPEAQIEVRARQSPLRRETRVVCARHGLSGGTQLTERASVDLHYTTYVRCSECLEREQACEQAVAIVRRLALFASHVLWEHETDSSVKRACLLDLSPSVAVDHPDDYDDERFRLLELESTAVVVVLTDSAPADAAPPSVVDEARGVRELLLELD